MNGQASNGDSRWRPALGTLVFVVLVPGTVIGYVPYSLTGWTLGEPLLGLSLTRWVGVAIFLAGAVVFVDFLARFVLEGRGTPAPVAPPKQLVVRGSFRYVRNPGYVGALSMILGQGFWFGSSATLLYGLCVGIAFHLFVVFYEEPVLRRQFGAGYEAYCREVPRWVPRVRRGAQR